jgi:hypothetical protein
MDLPLIKMMSHEFCKHNVTIFMCELETFKMCHGLQSPMMFNVNF